MTSQGKKNKRPGKNRKATFVSVPPYLKRLAFIKKLSQYRNEIRKSPPHILAFPLSETHVNAGARVLNEQFSSSLVTPEEKLHVNGLILYESLSINMQRELHR